MLERKPLHTGLTSNLLLLQPSNYRFSFCHYPFVYDPASKARILQLENMMAQYQEFGNSIRRAMMGGNACPYLILKVRRGPYLLQDTLVQVMATEYELCSVLAVAVMLYAAGLAHIGCLLPTHPCSLLPPAASCCLVLDFMVSN